LATSALLTATPTGDALELRPGGSWTAANVATLETLSAVVAPQLERSTAVTMDMTEVGELDTLGAWLIEKMSRRATAAGHRVKVVGVADNYAGLIDEVRQVNRRDSVPAPARKPLLVKVEDLGRWAFGATEDVSTSCRCWARFFWRSSVCCAGRNRCG
jgi:phospholipid/cholesterol/gamma-HCH transport system permease protein